MKTNRNTFAALITAAAALIAAPASHAVNRTLILLQENSNGKSYLEGFLSGTVQNIVDDIIDTVIENGEAAKFQALADGRYERFINLSDDDCTRANLLAQLIAQSNQGYTVDLAILGHGGTESLNLHNNEKLTGRTFQTIFVRGVGTTQIVVPGTIRSMLTEARAQQGPNFNFKLRLVHMCNCFGGTVNDDWLAIGAKVSVGAPMMDWMPEPMNTFFWNDFVKNDKRVSPAAADSLAATRIVYQVVPTYSTVNQEIGLNKLQETQQLVSGNGNLIFKDECQMAVNEEFTFTLQANQTHTFPLIHLVAGQVYSYTATGSWNSGAIGSPTVNANGYTPGFLDAARRHSSNMMCLVGERFNHLNDELAFINGSGFRIGANNTLTAGGHGFLNLYANDIITGYGDNTGSVNVTIRRVQ